MNEKENLATSGAPAKSPRLPLTNREKDVVRALACVMWADGHASPAERAIVQHVIDALDATPEERQEMTLWLATDCLTLADIDVERLSADDKEVLFNDATLLAYSDDIVLPSERAVLVKLGARLGLSDDVVQRILLSGRDEEAISLPSRALEERLPAAAATPPAPPPLPDAARKASNSDP